MIAHKKKYDVLKQKLKEKGAADESGLKIRNSKAGPELVKVNSFRRERWSDLAVLSTNADYLSSKIDKSQALKPQIVVITESLPKN